MANCFSGFLDCMSGLSLAFMRAILLISCVLLVLGQLFSFYGLYVLQNDLADLYPGLEAGFWEYAQVVGILVLGLIGCHGAYTKNPSYLKAFAFIVVVCSISQVLFYPEGSRDEWRENSKKFYDRMTDYAQDYEFNQTPGSAINKATKAWDLLQKNLVCCGLNSPKDWPNKWKMTEKNVLPKSCCLRLSRAANQYPINGQCTLEHAFDVGCYDRIDNIIESGARNTITIALINVILAAFALILAKQSERELELIRVAGANPQYQRFDGSVYVRQSPRVSAMPAPQVNYTKQPPVAPPLYPNAYGIDSPPKYDRT